MSSSSASKAKDVSAKDTPPESSKAVATMEGTKLESMASGVVNPPCPPNESTKKEVASSGNNPTTIKNSSPPTIKQEQECTSAPAVPVTSSGVTQDQKKSATPTPVPTAPIAASPSSSNGTSTKKASKDEKAKSPVPPSQAPSVQAGPASSAPSTLTPPPQVSSSGAAAKVQPPAGTTTSTTLPQSQAPAPKTFTGQVPPPPPPPSSKAQGRPNQVVSSGYVPPSGPVPPSVPTQARHPGGPVVAGHVPPSKAPPSAYHPPPPTSSGPYQPHPTAPPSSSAPSYQSRPPVPASSTTQHPPPPPPPQYPSSIPYGVPPMSGPGSIPSMRHPGQYAPLPQSVPVQTSKSKKKSSKKSKAQQQSQPPAYTLPPGVPPPPPYAVPYPTGMPGVAPPPPPTYPYPLPGPPLTSSNTTVGGTATTTKSKPPTPQTVPHPPTTNVNKPPPPSTATGATSPVPIPAGAPPPSPTPSRKSSKSSKRKSSTSASTAAAAAATAAGAATGAAANGNGSSNNSTTGASSSGAPGENTGRWTAEEHRLFLQGLDQHGKGWKKIASLIKSRTVVQIRTHAQKYFQKLAKARQNGEVPVDGEHHHHLSVDGQGGMILSAHHASVAGVSPNGLQRRPVIKKRKHLTGTKRKSISSIVNSVANETGAVSGDKKARLEDGAPQDQENVNANPKINTTISPALVPFIVPKTHIVSSSDISQTGSDQSDSGVQLVDYTKEQLEDSLFRFLTPSVIENVPPPSILMMDHNAKSSGGTGDITGGVDPIKIPDHNTNSSNAAPFGGELSPTGVDGLSLIPDWFAKGDDIELLLEEADSLDWLEDPGTMDESVKQAFSAAVTASCEANTQHQMTGTDATSSGAPGVVTGHHVGPAPVSNPNHQPNTIPGQHYTQKYSSATEAANAAAGLPHMGSNNDTEVQGTEQDQFAVFESTMEEQEFVSALLDS